MATIGVEHIGHRYFGQDKCAAYAVTTRWEDQEQVCLHRFSDFCALKKQLKKMSPSLTSGLSHLPSKLVATTPEARLPRLEEMLRQLLTRVTTADESMGFAQCERVIMEFLEIGDIFGSLSLRHLAPALDTCTPPEPSLGGVREGGVMQLTSSPVRVGAGEALTRTAFTPITGGSPPKRSEDATQHSFEHTDEQTHL
jgi:hypothetical protein